MIEVKNLVKQYGNHRAVNDLSFTVEDGQIYGFLGPNGAGKSTTMNMMTGYLAASSGTVVINGYDMRKEPEKAKKCIGYLPEIPPVYPDQTVKEYLMFVAELKKVPKKDRMDAVQKVMEMTSIDTMENRLIKNLSKGYRQRVGMAQAILGDPNVIILDEPMVGLDPAQIIEIRNLIKELSKKHTIIISSHILSEISEICDHILIIEHGNKKADGTLEDIQSMTETGILQFRYLLKATKEQFEACLEEQEGFEVVSLTEKAEKQIEVMVAMEEDHREDLFYRFASHQIPILSLVEQERTLEDAFLELTNENTEKQEEESC